MQGGAPCLCPASSPRYPARLTRFGASPIVRPMSSAKWTDHEVAELAMIVAEAAKGIPPWELPRSLLGRLRSAAASPHSEYLMFISRDVRRTAKYVADVLIPSFHRHAPKWVPAGLRSVFFHQTTIERWPDQPGRYASFPAEEWF